MRVQDVIRNNNSSTESLKLSEENFNNKSLEEAESAIFDFAELKNLE